MRDCNLEFRDPDKERPEIDAFLKSLNRKELDRQGNAELNSPFLDVHPKEKEAHRTAARQRDTYDHIAIIFRDRRLPDYKQNQAQGQRQTDTTTGYSTSWSCFHMRSMDLPLVSSRSRNRSSSSESPSTT